MHRLQIEQKLSAHGRRQHDGDPVLVFYLKIAANIFHPFFHIAEAIAKRSYVIIIKANTIVFDDDHKVLICLDPDPNLARLRMFYNIMQCLFQYEIDISTKLAAKKDNREIFRRLYFATDSCL